jgi:O-succinylbenzoic acid--CoA ligase
VLGARDLDEGDLVAVPAQIGPLWLPVIAAAWESRAALLPLDQRLSERERAAVLERARPTVVLRGTEHLERPDGGRAVASETAFVFHTSGTSGTPKLVELSRAAIRAAVGGSITALGVTERDVWVSCLPAAHVGGVLVLLRGAIHGSPISVLERFSPDAVARTPASFVSLVPTMLSRLLDAGIDLSTYRAILVGGGGLRADLRARAEAAGAPVVETYGLTESCGGIVYDGVPFAGTDVRVVDGMIELRGPTLMTGYLDDAEATQAAFDGGWLRTRDAGTVDRDGLLHVFGRIDEAIDSGGELVWPQEVEAALAAHPAVADVAVAGARDEEWGQRVVAFVVASDPQAPPTLEELRDHAAALVARFKTPRQLVLVDALPRTASGKVRRSALTVPGE